MSVDDAKSSIELQVTSLDQLFNSLDPFPFRERDLDKSAEEYIVSWARELPSFAAIDIVIHLPAVETKHWHEQEVKDAFRHYFDYRAEIVGRAFRELFRIGRRSLAIGVVVLLASVGLSEFTQRSFGHQGFAAIFSEGLIILGWVANWRPLEILLYDWWPIARQRRLYRRLAAATVSFSLNEKTSAAHIA